MRQAQQSSIPKAQRLFFLFPQKLVKIPRTCWQLSLQDHGSHGSAKVQLSVIDFVDFSCWGICDISMTIFSYKTLEIPSHFYHSTSSPCSFCATFGHPNISPRHREGLFDCQDRYLSGQELGEEELLWSRCGSRQTNTLLPWKPSWWEFKGALPMPPPRKKNKALSRDY